AAAQLLGVAGGQVGPHGGHAVASGAEPHGPFFGGGVCGVLGGVWGVACDRVVDGGVQCGAAGPVAAGKGPGEAADDTGLDGADDLVGHAGQAAGGVDGELL